MAGVVDAAVCVCCLRYQMFLPWPSMVAASTSQRYFVDSRSAARRKMAARASQLSSSHCFLAARAVRMASWTVCASALW